MRTPCPRHCRLRYFEAAESCDVNLRWSRHSSSATTVPSEPWQVTTVSRNSSGWPQVAGQLGTSRTLQHRHRRHPEKNATQTAAISWRLTTGSRTGRWRRRCARSRAWPRRRRRRAVPSPARSPLRTHKASDHQQDSRAIMPNNNLTRLFVASRVTTKKIRARSGLERRSRQDLAPFSETQTTSRCIGAAAKPHCVGHGAQSVSTCQL